MKTTINLKDNNCGSSCLTTREQYDDISSFANIPIKELLEKNKNILVFPERLGDFNDDIGENEILHLSGSRNEIQTCKITTGNLMGFIGSNNTKVIISSRFSSSDNKEHDYFLTYLLQKVLCLNLVNLNYSFTSGDGFDLLIYLFPNLLKKACSQGLIKKYRTYKNNDNKVKGTIDVARHIKTNPIFNGRIAYNNREYSSDNFITQLIRHTIELIKCKNNGEYILNSDYETTKCVHMIYDNTPSYSLNQRAIVIAENLRPFNHPYYTEYEPLVKLCLQILRYDKVNYAESDSDIYGVIFDGAWLWEEFLATFLTNSDLGFIHPQNKRDLYPIYVYQGNKRYPDFYRGMQTSPNNKNNNFVLDAKYKHLNSKLKEDDIKSSFSRDDLHQLITYMYILPADKGALIYPLDKTNVKSIIFEKQLYGYGGSIYTIGFPIPQRCKDYKEFSIQIENSINKTKNVIYTRFLVN